MTRLEFLEELKKVLDSSGTTLFEETNLDDLEEYDSLAVISIIAMVHEKTGKRLQGIDFQKVTTVKSLMDLVGL